MTEPADQPKHCPGCGLKVRTQQDHHPDCRCKGLFRGQAVSYPERVEAAAREAKEAIRAYHSKPEENR
jgi:hypothetical protein